jgi:DNA-binding Lrp family transcriptional regulator
MMSADRKWRDVLPIHPAAEIFPLMRDVAPDEFKALVEDIRKYGLKRPIEVLSTWVKSPDGFTPALELVNVVVDGRNRLDAMEAAGISIFRMDGRLEDSYFRPIGNKDMPNVEAFVISANIRRRHLSAEDKRGLIAKLIKAAPETSNRQIADQVKVSHPHVAKVRRKLEETGDVETVTTSVDTKGRRQPVHKTEAKKQSRTQRSSPPADLVSPAEPEDTLQEHIDRFADQIQDVAEALGAQDRALFLQALRRELDAIERVLAAEAAWVAAE